MLFLCTLERWDATLQGIAHAEEFVRNMDKAKTSGTTKKTAESLLKNSFRRASAKSVAMGKARLKMERAVAHAERILLEKKRQQTAMVASREEQAELIAEELYHKPGTILDKKELAHIYQTTECEELRPEVECSSIPFYHSVRTISGLCNNVEHSTYGASFTPFSRIIPAQYANGINSLFNQAFEPDLGPFLAPSPSARLISDTAILDRDVNDSLHTHLIMQWGQFMDHDLDLAVEFPEQECDLEECETNEICAPVRIPEDDEIFGLGTAREGECHPFQRTVPACVENPFEFTAREQVNELTHYIDGSMVYGSTDARAEFLREFEGGLLRVSAGENLPLQPPCAPSENPLGVVTPGSNNAADCCPNEDFTTCGVAGDIRALEHVSLNVMHTVWVREHNRIARALSSLNPQWDDTRVYIEARDIVIAQIQQITFSEYLPALFGSTSFNKLIGPYQGYNPEIDVSIPNAFATAAYRFGHSQIQPMFERLGSDLQSVAAGPLSLRDSFFSATELENGGGVGPIVQGWVRQPARLMDEFLNSVLTTQLFERVEGEGMDLATLNIQRGRDHGLPRYGTWKRFCADAGIGPSDFRNELTAIRLRKLYGSDDNIDLFVGALAEEPLPGSILGAVLSCIFSITFSRLRSGDRFWYENLENDVFTEAQLAEVRRTSFARVLCDNGGLQSVQPSAFFLDVDDFETGPCTGVTGINFEPWREETFCFYRGGIMASTPTVVSYSNRPLGGGRDTISTFQNDEPSRCIPIRCPDATPRDVFAILPTTRRGACTAIANPPDPTRSVSFRETVTTSDIDNVRYFDSLEACEASSNDIISFVCDGLSQTTSKMASTAQLENELARALNDQSSKKARAKTMDMMTSSTILEDEAPNGNVYNLDDIDGEEVSKQCNNSPVG